MGLPETFNNKYKIIKPLGHGAMKDVLHAHDIIQDRDVALKIQTDEHLQESINVQLYSPDLVSAVRNEAVALTRIGRHPRIAQIYDANIDQSTQRFYIAEELVLGETLADTARNAKRDSSVWMRTVKSYARDIASGLMHLRKKKIIHGDLRLENILVDKEGHAKITDFGLAALSDRMPPTLGSMIYRAPELIEGKQQTTESDIWQFGVLLYHLVTGQYPYSIEADWKQASLEEKRRLRDALKQKILNEPFIPAQKINSGVPVTLDGVISRCLSKEPAKRPTPRYVYHRLSPYGWLKEAAIAGLIALPLVPLVGKAVDWYAARSEEPASLVFTSSQDGKNKLYSANAALHPPEKVDAGWCFGLAANDGSLAYVRLRNGIHELVMRNAAQETILCSADELKAPVWSQDGRLAIGVRTGLDTKVLTFDRSGEKNAENQKWYETGLAWHPSGNYLTALSKGTLVIFEPGGTSRTADEYPSGIQAYAWTSKGLLIAIDGNKRPPAGITLFKGRQDAAARHELEEAQHVHWQVPQLMGELRDKTGFWYVDKVSLYLNSWNGSFPTTILNLGDLNPLSGKDIGAVVEGKDAREWFVIGRTEDLDRSGILDAGDNCIWRFRLERFGDGSPVNKTRYAALRAINELQYSPFR